MLAHRRRRRVRVKRGEVKRGKLVLLGPFLYFEPHKTYVKAFYVSPDGELEFVKLDPKKVEGVFQSSWSGLSHVPLHRIIGKGIEQPDHPYFLVYRGKWVGKAPVVTRPPRNLFVDDVGLVPVYKNGRVLRAQIFTNATLTSVPKELRGDMDWREVMDYHIERLEWPRWADGVITYGGRWLPLVKDRYGRGWFFNPRMEPAKYHIPAGDASYVDKYAWSWADPLTTYTTMHGLMRARVVRIDDRGNRWVEFVGPVEKPPRMWRYFKNKVMEYVFGDPYAVVFREG